MTPKRQAGKRKDRKRAKVESVPVSDLRLKRYSRHHDLMQEVLNKLEKLASHSAIKIELMDLPAKTLRSAVFRAATSRNIEITSFSDQSHLYILKKLPNSKPGAGS
jgi:hypothetical protein